MARSCPVIYGVEAGQSAVATFSNGSWRASAKAMARSMQSSRAEAAATQARRERACSRSTGTTATARSSSISASRPPSWPDAPHEPRGDLSRAHRGDGFGARIIIERIEETACPCAAVCAGGIAEKKSDAHADLRRRDWPRNEDLRLVADVRARSAISAAVLAGAYPDFQSAQKAMAHIQPRTYTRTRTRRLVTSSSSSSTASSTTPLAASPRPRSAAVMKDLLTIKEANVVNPTSTHMSLKNLTPDLEIWFATAAAPLRPRNPQGSRRTARPSSPVSTAPRSSRSRLSSSPCSRDGRDPRPHDSRRIARRIAPASSRGCTRSRRRRCGSAASRRCASRSAPPHAVQSRPPVEHDRHGFLNLNQARTGP